MLIALSGLPGSGKTSLARQLATRLSAVHIRVDTIEQALMRAGSPEEEVGIRGYLVGYAVATENLSIGLTVIADSVNPLPATRAAWRAAAAVVNSPCVEIEVVCSDIVEHRRRIESRTADIPGHQLPTWTGINEARQRYAAWDGTQLLVDTSALSASAAAEIVLQKLPGLIASRRP